MAGVILFMIGIGVYMSYFVSDPLEQFPLIQTHKSWGFVAFTLACIRVIWRLCNKRTPKLPTTMKPHEKFAAEAAHIGLYIFMFVMPLSGWLMSSASPLQDAFGIKNKVFGLFEMYDPFVPGDKALAELFGSIHYWSAIGLGLILCAHAGAALQHHFIKRDDILKRMIVGTKD